MLSIILSLFVILSSSIIWPSLKNSSEENFVVVSLLVISSKYSDISSFLITFSVLIKLSVIILLSVLLLSIILGISVK
jgi:hypothetical protein